MYFKLYESNQIPDVNSVKGMSASRHRKKSCLSKVNSQRKSRFFDSVSTKENEEINIALTEFFAGGNIAHSVAESLTFKSFLKKLRPEYINRQREKLSLRVFWTKFMRNIRHVEMQLIKNRSYSLMAGKTLLSIRKMLYACCTVHQIKHIFLNSRTIRDKVKTLKI